MPYDPHFTLGPEARNIITEAQLARGTKTEYKPEYAEDLESIRIAALYAASDVVGMFSSNPELHALNLEQAKDWTITLAKRFELYILNGN